MAENQPLSFADSIRGARERLAQEHRAQAEQIRKLLQELTGLQQLHERTEQEANRQYDEMARAGADAAAAALVAAAAAAQASAQKALENVLGAIRALTTCTIPEQVFAVLTEEASHWGVRAAVFDVRGKAAWGASASGFGPALSEQVLRGLSIPLNLDNPFRQVYETAGHVNTSAESLKKNRNVLDKFKPAPHSPVLLLPVRSAGAVAAIFYADPGEKGDPIPVRALRIVAEFAGAQIDRLIALSGGFAAEEVDGQAGEPKAQAGEVRGEAADEEPAPAERPSGETAFAGPLAEQLNESTAAEPAAPTAVAEGSARGEAVGEAHLEFAVVEPPTLSVGGAVESPEQGAHAIESGPALAVVETAVEEVSPTPPPEVLNPVIVAERATPPAPAPADSFDLSQLSETEQKLHKDAKRFAKLLVSEIELYNKAKVADGRQNRDLYKRLKPDIDRSRQTFEKRFGKSLSKGFNYFHDELVKTLAVNDIAVLGPEYPGPPA